MATTSYEPAGGLPTPPLARATVSRSAKHNDRQSTWLKALVARRGFNRTIVALANKTARIAWVLLSRKQEYAAP
jgi:transposase